MEVYDASAPIGEQKFNYEVWEQNKITMKEKRALMTWIFGRAYQEFCSARYNYVRAKAFRMTGMHILSSGKNDEHISVEDYPSFRPLAPGTPLNDDHYISDSYSNRPQFKYHDELPGGNDEMGPDSSSSSDDSSSSYDGDDDEDVVEEAELVGEGGEADAAGRGHGWCPSP